MMKTYRHVLLLVLWLALSAQIGAQPPPKRPMLVAASALNASAVISESTMARCRETAIYIRWSAGTSAGSVKVETASDSTYASTWAPLATVAWSAVTKEDVVQVTGVQLSIRTRISDAIVGGTVSTWLVCN